MNITWGTVCWRNWPSRRDQGTCWQEVPQSIFLHGPCCAYFTIHIFCCNHFLPGHVVLKVSCKAWSSRRGVVYLLAALHLGGIKGHLKVADKGWVAAQGGWGNLASLRLPSFVVQDPLKELSSTLSFEQRNTYIFFVEEVEEVLRFKLFQLIRPQSDLHININIKYVISLSKYTGKLVSFFICLHWCRLCTFCH